MKKVIILYNKISANPTEDELDVLNQAELVKNALIELGYQPETMEFSLDLKTVTEALRENKPEFVFNLVESVDNNDELIYISPSILEHLKIPYSGNPLQAMFVTTNKILTKKILFYNNLNTCKWYNIEQAESLEKDKTYIFKPVSMDGSSELDESNVFKGNDLSILQKVKDRKNYFIEEFIDGREFNVSVLAGEVMPVAEIVFKNYPEDKPRVVGYNAKWNEGTFEYENTERTFELENEKELTEKLKSISLRCWEVFGLRGYARVDFRVDKNNNPFILEINSNPCIAPESGFIAATKQGGYSAKEVIHKIIEDII